jgi:hypothetical protein
MIWACTSVYITTHRILNNGRFIPSFRAALEVIFIDLVGTGLKALWVARVQYEGICCNRRVQGVIGPEDLVASFYGVSLTLCSLA